MQLRGELEAQAGSPYENMIILSIRWDLGQFLFINSPHPATLKEFLWSGYLRRVYILSSDGLRAHSNKDVITFFLLHKMLNFTLNVRMSAFTACKPLKGLRWCRMHTCNHMPTHRDKPRLQK